MYEIEESPNNLNLSLSEVNDLMRGAILWDNMTDRNVIWRHIESKTVYTDLSKSYVDLDVVIQDGKTGKFYKARLTDSPYGVYDKENETAYWKEVKEETETIIIKKYV